MNRKRWAINCLNNVIIATNPEEAFYRAYELYKSLSDG